jgi:DNA (cytosine-5)-methyltransferase 1
MTVGSLFSGIGGFDLGFERAGYDVRWQVEIDDYANRVLAKHWPHVRRYRDIRAINWRDVEPVDVVCGGFPCQPHSVAGRRRASEDDRDLWPEVVRCLRETQPRWFMGENVTGLLSSEDGRFFGTVLRDLAACGFDVEWDCLPAFAFGAPHRRDRVWIVAHSTRELRRWRGTAWHGWTKSSDGREDVADASRLGLEGFSQSQQCQQAQRRIFTRCEVVGGSDSAGPGERWWEPEPAVGRVAHGVSARVDRLRGLGNAIVPQIAEWLAGRILAADAA